MKKNRGGVDLEKRGGNWKEWKKGNFIMDVLKKERKSQRDATYWLDPRIIFSYLSYTY